MTPEEMQVAIAEFCGWTDIERNPFYPNPTLCGFNELLGRTSAANLGAKWGIPEFYSDLNAMHEAEKALTDEQWPEYRNDLRTVVLGGIRLVSQWCKADLHATAAQRAEALCRTLFPERFK